MDVMKKAYLDKHEVAGLLGVCLRTVDNLIKKNHITFVKLPTGTVRIPAEAVHMMIAAATRPARLKNTN